MGLTLEEKINLILKMNTTYKEKLKKLPQNIQDILLLNVGDRIEYYIYKKNNILDSRYYLIADTLSKVYFKEIGLEELLVEITNNFKIEEPVAKKLAIDLVGMRILPIKDYLKNEDFDYFFHSLGGNMDDYEKFIIFTQEAVEKESRGEEVDINKILGIEIEVEEKNQEKKISNIEFDPKKEKIDSLKVFKTTVRPLLVSADKDILEDYNLTLLELITDDPKFKRDLEDSLYDNNEAITASKFKLVGHVTKPTIGNWLKDFIKKNGTTMFSDVVLMEYLTKTDNTKNLYTNERVLLSKLLQLYRNLKFYPSSQKGLREEDWEIIPSQEIKDKKDKRRTIGTPKTTAERNIEIMKEESKDFKDNSLEKLAIDEEIKHEKKVEELRFMATKFAEGSLERKAIEEELHKIEHNK